VRPRWVAWLVALVMSTAGTCGDDVERSRVQPCTKDCLLVEIRFSSPTERSAWVRVESSTPDGHRERIPEKLERLPHSAFVTYSPGVHVTIKAWIEVNYADKMPDINVQRSVKCEVIDVATRKVYAADDGKMLGLAGHAFCKWTT
jgi:hypothetical protein